ncbi:hypothetical protein SASPL_113272 [Salvia splendens]|uniref:Uncharacterized protein n=1 Tax=Salvia splendens TaxID=180675 RepID=A0A8X8XZQ3_SALSN|nr:hypothetical protein SASPL_113272 [Salvia splendens]
METHVLVLPFPGQGHINPALAFATRLASMSLSITVLITTDLINKATVCSSSSVSIARISDEKESIEGEESFEAYFKRFTAVLSANLAEFIDHNPAKLLVYDSMMPWAMDVAPPGLALPAVFHYVGGCVGDFLPFEKWGFETILKWLCDQFLNLEKADWIFINTFDILERETIGPNHPPKPQRLQQPNHHQPLRTKTRRLHTMARLQRDRLGSIASLGKPQMEELAHGLVASNRHFLWVARASEADKLPRDFNPGEKGLVVACFVSHCGWNSTLEAVGHGVPVVALPQWVDQTTDAKFVEDVWGIGVVKERRLLSVLKELWEERKGLR